MGAEVNGSLVHHQDENDKRDAAVAELNVKQGAGSGT